MSTKTYTYHAEKNRQVLDLYKWLRKEGELNRDYKLGMVNYSKLEITFLNDKLELQYILKWHWIKS